MYSLLNLVSGNGIALKWKSGTAFYSWKIFKIKICNSNNNFYLCVVIKKSAILNKLMVWSFQQSK